jgi:hypothetical protein
MKLSAITKCAAIFAVTSLLYTSSLRAEPTEFNSSIFILTDLSKSYFDSSTLKLMKKTLGRTNSLVVSLTKRIPTPVMIHYLSIDLISLSKAPLCAAGFKSTLLGRGKKNLDDDLPIIHKRPKLRSFLGQCRDFILAQKPRQGTDISGAIELATRIAKGQDRGLKIMIIISDLYESRWEKAPQLTAKLDGFRIGLVYRVRDMSALEQESFDENLLQWKTRLEKAGAERVITVIESGNFSSRLNRELSE